MNWSLAILLSGTLITPWFWGVLGEWRRTARYGRFTAEREMATWRYRRGIGLLVLLLALMVSAIAHLWLWA